MERLTVCTDKKSLPHRLLLCESSKVRILFLDDRQRKITPPEYFVSFPVSASF